MQLPFELAALPHRWFGCAAAAGGELRAAGADRHRADDRTIIAPDAESAARVASRR